MEATEDRHVHADMESTAQTVSVNTEDLPVLSKKKAKKAKKVIQKIKVTPGSVDAMVQHTNDDSVVSKRSAVTHKYIEDPFLRHFVKKPSRRSPLINRGYYLRMKVIDDTITHLIRYFADRGASSGEARPVQVISLGAGFDTYALRALLAPRADMPSTEHVYFYDVDFPAVMQNKAALMQAAPEGSFPSDMTLQPTVLTHTVKSTHYNAVGVDLRDAANTLVPLLTAASMASNETFQTRHPTIIYAECVMQYMPAADAQRLVHFIAHTFEDAIFVAYDQIHPDDSFGHIMQQSLRQKSSPLLAIEARPDGRALTRSALKEGMACALFANFYDLSRQIIAGDEHVRVTALEPFDELEEWAEMCEHYGITLATTRAETGATCVQASAAFKPVTPQPPTPPADNVTRVPVSAHTWPTGRFGLEGWGNGGSCVEPIGTGATAEDVLIVSFGGFVVGRTHERVNKVFVHSLREGELHVVVAGAGDTVGATASPPPLCFHSFTRLSPFLYLVFGGRTNPDNVHAESYLLQLHVPATIELGCHVTAVWRRLESSGASSTPPARYRHSMCTAGPETKDTPARVLMFGGKTAEGTLLNDCWRAVVDAAGGTIDWTPVALSHADGEEEANTTTITTAPVLPPPMCSAALTWSPGESVAYLSGGLLTGEQCAATVYAISPNSGSCQRMSGIDFGGRFSHSACVVQVSGVRQLLILGGSTCSEKETIAPAVLLNLDTRSLSVATMPANVPWWSRHSCLPLARGTVAVVAGGYTCFSFGTFAARPVVLRIGDDCAPWPLHGGAHNNNNNSDTAAAGESSVDALYVAGAPVLTHARLLCLPRPPVETLPYNAETFLAVAKAASRPVVFRRVPLGRCVASWACPDYLKETEGAATVSVHVAEGSTVLDFVRKNFVHRHVSFGELVDHVVDATACFEKTGVLPPETWYYRSIAAHMKSDRANLWQDFPKLGADFELPEAVAAFVMPRIHQSCLRINAVPLQLWTHYDTQDNVLCQIVGRKRVVMFPPSCHNDLYMSGSSSPVLNIDAPDLLKYPRFIEACKHATEVILEPGDMLYFPANWFHHITTLSTHTPSSADAKCDQATPSGLTISVNVFFRHFDAGEYDPKDLYGNKDLPVCTELREKLVAYAQKLVADSQLRSVTETPIPREYARFAVHQAIQDMERLLAVDEAADVTRP